MSQNTTVEETRCTLTSFERNRYFFGKPMTVRDFEAEQQYFNGKSRLVNRLIHGIGIICGLQLKELAVASGKLSFYLAKGAALDCCGNLIVVSQSEKMEAAGLIEGKNYLYIKYAENSRQPVMVTANVSSCEEVCCYNRIHEGFEVFLTRQAPRLSGARLYGKVTAAGSNNKPILGAKIEASQQGTVVAAARSDSSGEYSLRLAEGDYKVRASATGFMTSEPKSVTPANDRSVKLDLALAPETSSPPPAAVCSTLTESYYAAHLGECPECQNPAVLLAVLEVKEGVARIDESETAQYRAIVYGNRMLHDLLCDHLADFNNPHRTTAEQIRALQSVNGLGNTANKPYTSNVNLGSNGTLDINNDETNLRINLKLAPDAVKRSHLNEDTINNFLIAAGGVTIQPEERHKRINIKTTPAETVKSVAPAGNATPGSSLNFAREDHVHELADGAVTTEKIDEGAVEGSKLAPDSVSKSHLARDFFTDLFSSDETININADAATERVTFSTIPPAAVNSVGRENQVGSAPSFARSDHVHRLAINDCAPDVYGQFHLTPGDNVTITRKDENELVIAARAAALKTESGLVVFENMQPQEIREAGPIQLSHDEASVAIVLALETGSTTGSSVYYGDYLDLLSRAVLRQEVENLSVSLLAHLNTPPGSFTLKAADIRASNSTYNTTDNTTGITAGIPRTYRVRWWAIPSINTKPTLIIPAKEENPPS
jgi:Carboxypeptidase regulatory-like domain